MSLRNPSCKREFEEASSKSVSLLKKMKLNNDSHDVVFVASSWMISASDECSVNSEGEENDQSSSFSSGCHSSESKEIAAHQISETETFITNNFRNETNRASEGLGETITEMESSSSTEMKANRKKSQEINKTPTPAEIEDFLSKLENDDKQKQFIEKYNFDIVNDEPLEGRYKWERITP